MEFVTINPDNKIQRHGSEVTYAATDHTPEVLLSLHEYKQTQADLAACQYRYEADVNSLTEEYAAALVDRDASRAENERLLRRNKAFELALSPEAVETLAAHCHNEQWAGWTRWMIDNWEPSSVERWERQLATPYEDLPDYDKESDRKEARRIISVLRGLVEARAALGEQEGSNG